MRLFNSVKRAKSAFFRQFLATNQEVVFCWDFPLSLLSDLKPSFERRVVVERVVHVLEKIDEGAK